MPTDINLRPSTESELATFSQFETENDTSEFIIPYPPAKHLECFHSPGVIYLTILHGSDTVGFFILHKSDNIIEFRRIVISKASRGIGQLAIQLMEQHCTNTLKADKIWLDVFDHNSRGRHIYEKLGYQTISTTSFEGRLLHIMEKRIQQGDSRDALTGAPDL